MRKLFDRYAPWIVTLIALAGLVGPPVYSQTSVANSPADLAGKILMVADSATARTVTNAFTFTGLQTFNRGAAAPFAINAASLKVSNLDADKLDGVDGAAYATLTGAETLTNKVLTSPTINTSTIASATLSGTLSGTPTASGAWTWSSADSTTKVGTSTETVKASGVIDTDSTQQGTAANTSDTALRTYTLPANAFSATSKVIKVTAWGSFAANGNTKTVRIKWNGLSGTTVVAITLSVNNQNWILVGNIVRTGSSTQDVLGYALVSSPSQDLVTTFGTSAATDTGAIDIVISAQNGTASANDIRYEGSIIEFAN